MIVRLSTAQLRIVHDVCDQLGPVFARWPEQQTRRSSKQRWDVTMPAVGWRHIQGVLLERCFTAHGGRRPGTRGSMLRANKAITTALNRRDVHPALYRGQLGAAGTLFDSFTVWATDDPLWCWSPYPAVVDWAILIPDHRTHGQMRYTVWRQADENETNHLVTIPIFDPRSHLELQAAISYPSRSANSII